MLKKKNLPIIWKTWEISPLVEAFCAFSTKDWSKGWKKRSVELLNKRRKTGKEIKQSSNINDVKLFSFLTSVKLCIFWDIWRGFIAFAKLKNEGESNPKLHLK